MEIDGSRGTRGPLSQDERRHRSAHNLCAYCGQSGHAIANCQVAGRRQARGTYPSLPQPPAHQPAYVLPPGYQLPPPPGAYPGPWAMLPGGLPLYPHTQFGYPPPKFDPPPPVVPGNGPPSQ